MASRRNTLISSAAVLALAGGYGLYLVTAQTGAPELAQSPMNITNTIPPAFIMAVDNSGSMTDQTLFRSGDGIGRWVSGSFFTGSGVPNDQGSGGTAYNAVFASRLNEDLAPPLNAFGAIRSHEFNRGYFNPGNTYDPWLQSDGTPDANASLTATLTDPRRTDWTLDMTADHRDRTDDNGEDADLFNEDADLVSGEVLRAGWLIRNQTNSAQTCTTTGPSLVFPASGGAYFTLPADRTLNAGCTSVRVRRTRPSRPEANELVTVPNGTVLPNGTWYYRAATNACGGLGARMLQRNQWVQLTAAHTVTGDCGLGIQFFPATFYLRTSTAAPTGYTGTPVLVTNGGGPGVNLYRYEIKPANYAAGAYNTAIQNFANWHQYYGNRNRAMIGAMTHSMAEVNNMRVGYFQINPAPFPGGVDMHDMAVAADKTALYTQMRALDAGNNTPTRRATASLGREFRRTDDDAPIQLACQKNAGMLFTDGYINDANTGISPEDGVTTVGNADNFSGAPFPDSASNTLADYAMYSYVNNLRPDMTAGQVPVSAACNVTPPAVVDPSLDCNTNLHMNFYGITLGARGAEYDVDAAATADPYTNTPSWTASGLANNQTGNTDLTPAAVDDIWHAALNTRGEFINANSPSDITDAMRRILASVSEGASPSGTIGVTGSRIGVGSLTVQPTYESGNNGTDWFSTLTAETVSADATSGVAAFTQAWEASTSLGLQASRTINFGRTGSSVVPTVSDFAAANVSLDDLCAGTAARCTSAELAALASSGTISNTDAVAYLRGTRTLEGAGGLRTRTTILGDIINSPPTLSSPTDDYGYKALTGSLGTDYATYLADKKALDRPLVLVGANDGMFHVFDGRADAPGGDEVYAYIPATALGSMGNLLFPYVAADKNDQKFQHRYYVDGPITVSDVYIGGAWKTIAVGTAGAGGRSVFALDITNPDAITVLWEVNDLVTGSTGISNNIGHVLGKPVIVPVKATATDAPSWKVIFGNGYNSTNQLAQLFVVDAATGDVTTIEATETTPPAYNGLGNLVVVDRKRFDSTSGDEVSGRDRFSDTVYAADQHGAVWKFDLLGTPSLALSAPLFVAEVSGVRQSITGGLTAAAGPAGGVMVYFGTGSFSFTGDPQDISQQTIYGILDRNAAVTRSELLQQTVVGDDADFRTTSANAMVAGNKGWLLDLNADAGERFVGNPRIESGIVFFPSYQPSGGTGSADCSVNGTNWLYGLNALSGGAALSFVRFGSPTGDRATDGTGAVALNTGGTAPVKDVAVMTTPRVGPLGAGATAAEIAAANDATCSMVVRVAGAPEMYLPRPCGRQSWRQVR